MQELIVNDYRAGKITRARAVRLLKDLCAMTDREAEVALGSPTPPRRSIGYSLPVTK